MPLKQVGPRRATRRAFTSHSAETYIVVVLRDILVPLPRKVTLHFDPCISCQNLSSSFEWVCLIV